MARKFPSIYSCSSQGREKQMVVSDLDGTLLRSSNAFPYYMLMAWESPAGLARFTALLLLSPMAWLLYTFLSESMAIQLMVWVTFVGVKMSDIESNARAVLPKFYTEDVHPEAWRVVSLFGWRYVLTATPRVMVEPFAKQYLGVDEVLGSELAVHRSSGRATGFVRGYGVLVGRCKEAALRAHFGDNRPDVGLGDQASDHAFLEACKEAYVLAPHVDVDPVLPSELCHRLIFHDGRFASKPTPSFALSVLLWLPLGTAISCLRMMACSLLPIAISAAILRCLGVKLVVNGTPPACAMPHADAATTGGALLVCTHRTLMDPVFVSSAMRRSITAVTYSLSHLSEAISPIPTMRLSRDRERDAKMMKKLLSQGDLVVCPEGTTCREPFLLRFSALFAELTDRLVPVATSCSVSMFHGTTARGWKGLDSFYFFLNPRPCYEVTFLSQLPLSQTCAAGKSPIEVANYVQHLLASALGFESTAYTRRDKYMALLRNNGTVSSKKRSDD